MKASVVGVFVSLEQFQENHFLSPVIDVVEGYGPTRRRYSAVNCDATTWPVSFFVRLPWGRGFEAKDLTA